MTASLAGKIAIVTGGGGACGRAVAARLARAGAVVTVADVDEAAAAIPGTRQVRADVTRAQDVEALCAGGVDVLVNTASAPFRPGAPMERWLATLEVDLVGALHVTRFGVEAMRRRGGGAIVHFGSTSALCHGRARAQSVPYDVAKAGVLRLATALASLGRERIRVSCLLPDWVATPEVQAYFDGLPEAERGRDGVPRALTTLDEIGDAVLDLATDETLAGRAYVIWSGGPRGLIPVGDPGYVTLEPR